MNSGEKMLDLSLMSEEEKLMFRWLLKAKILSFRGSKNDIEDMFDAYIKKFPDSGYVFKENIRKAFPELFTTTCVRDVDIQFTFRRESNFELNFRLMLEDFDEKNNLVNYLQITTLNYLFVDNERLCFSTLNYTFQFEWGYEKITLDKLKRKLEENPEYEVPKIWSNADEILDKIIASFSKAGKVNLAK